jgi:hypothetical protein
MHDSTMVSPSPQHEKTSDRATLPRKKSDALRREFGAQAVACHDLRFKCGYTFGLIERSFGVPESTARRYALAVKSRDDSQSTLSLVPCETC